LHPHSQRNRHSTSSSYWNMELKPNPITGTVTYFTLQYRLHKGHGGPLSHYHTHESMIPHKWLGTFTKSCIQACGRVRKRKRSCGQWTPVRSTAVLRSWMVASSLHVHYPEVTRSKVFHPGVAMLSWYILCAIARLICICATSSECFSMLQL